MNKVLRQLSQNPIFKRYQFIIAPIIAVILVGLGIVYIIFPQSLQYLETQKKIEEEKAKLDILKNKVGVLQEVPVNEYRDHLTTSYTALPQDRNITSAVGLVLGLISQTNLQVQDTSYSDINVDGEPTKNFRIRVDASGTVENVALFVSKLSQFPRLMRVYGMEYSGTPRKDSGSISVTLLGYFEPLTLVASTGDQSVNLINAPELEILNTVKANAVILPPIDNPQISGPKGKADPFE